MMGQEGSERGRKLCKVFLAYLACLARVINGSQKNDLGICANYYTFPLNIN
jgi:hypothetical protein